MEESQTTGYLIVRSSQYSALTAYVHDARTCDVKYCPKHSFSTLSGHGSKVPSDDVGLLQGSFWLLSLFGKLWCWIQYMYDVACPL